MADDVIAVPGVEPPSRHIAPLCGCARDAGVIEERRRHRFRRAADEGAQCEGRQVTEHERLLGRTARDGFEQRQRGAPESRCAAHRVRLGTGAERPGSCRIDEFERDPRSAPGASAGASTSATPAGRARAAAGAAARGRARRAATSRTSAPLASDLVAASSRPAAKLPSYALSWSMRAAADRDVPVAGRRVVDRVREAGRRKLAVGAGQRLAQHVAVAAFAAGRREHRRELLRIDAACATACVGDRHRERIDGPARPALGRRQAGRRRQRRVGPCVGGSPRSTGSAAGHDTSPGASRPMPRIATSSSTRLRGAQWAALVSRIAMVRSSRRGTAHAAFPRIRLALVPPKPNELLSTARSGACALRCR
jgi:hypothetical protein